MRETFDPGGNLPEDCTEWAEQHEQAIDAVAAQLAVAQAEREKLQQQVDRFENAQCITCAKDLDTDHAENA